ncbi:MAG TPA: hypothetical protein VE963_04020, partial [Reyranella sp.]|nr:hypothetical protein [Reyranella sp.]
MVEHAIDGKLLEIETCHLPPRERPTGGRQWTLAGPPSYQCRRKTEQRDGAEIMRAMLSETPGGPESLKLVELPS